jgi:hypothetical protein
MSTARETLYAVEVTEAEREELVRLTEASYVLHRSNLSGGSWEDTITAVRAIIDRLRPVGSEGRM